MHVTNWALFIFILVTASLLTSSLGLLLTMDPRKMQMLFAVILLPATMLGLVLLSWAALQNIRWLQIAILINPMVPTCPRACGPVLTPVLPHMPMWAVLALVGGTVGLRLPGHPHLHQARPQLRSGPRSYGGPRPRASPRGTGKPVVSARGIPLNGPVLLS